MSTLYKFLLVKEHTGPDGVRYRDTLASMEGHAWEVAPAMKQLARKIHESPPPVILEGQGSIL